mgnify:CR=1 FL=1|jgi:hypothetical protein
MPDRTSDVYGVDARREDVVFAMDFRPSTVLEQSQMHGDRVNLPVGTPTAPAPEFQSTGGRGSSDAEAAVRLNSQGRK